MPASGTCYIIAPLYQGEEKERILSAGENDLIICADGGYDAARQFGIEPDLVIGDFDSMPFDHIISEVETIRLPVHKDDTDMVVCLREARSRGYSSFFITGCLGGRLCHTLANLQCLYDCALRGEEAWMCDKTNLVRILLPGKYELTPPQERFFSLISYTPETSGINLQGTEWELEDAVLTNRFPLGVSNKTVRDHVSLSFAQGALVLVYAMD